MNTKSCKAKARRLQDWVAEKVEEHLGLECDKAIMGETGCDVKHEKLPLAIECKNTERLSVWSAYKQASMNAGSKEPCVFIKRNHHKPLVVLDAEYFLEIASTLMEEDE